MQKRKPIFRWVFGNAPAVTFSILGIAAVALFVVALSGGFEGWIAVTAIAVIILFVLATAAFVGGRRLGRQAETVTYAPDYPGYRLDVDTDTGARRIHHDPPPNL